MPPGAPPLPPGPPPAMPVFADDGNFLAKMLKVSFFSFGFGGANEQNAWFTKLLFVVVVARFVSGGVCVGEQQCPDRAVRGCVLSARLGFMLVFVGAWGV